MSLYEVVRGTVEKDGVQYGPDQPQTIVELSDHRANFLGAQVAFHSESESDSSDDAGRSAVEAPADPEGEAEVGTEFATPEDDEIANLMDGTLEDLETALGSGVWDDSIDALHEYEENNQDRAGAYDLLNEREAAISEER